MKKILFLTTANLPTNPRLLKEVDLLSKIHAITVVLFRLGNWSDAQNEEMMHNRSHIRFEVLDVTRSHFLYWLKWALDEKAGRLWFRFFPSSLFGAALGLSRRSVMMAELLERMEKPDLIIAHNLGALYPAWHWAQKWGIPFGYDAEDYDPGIYVPQGGKNYVPACEMVLRSCLPAARYITSASPLIGQHTIDLIGGHPNHRVVLNNFPSGEFVAPVLRDDNELRLIWFSQRISFGRGLEQLFEALKSILNSSTSQLLSSSRPLLILTLIGDLDPAFQQAVLSPFLDDVLRPLDVGETMGFHSFNDSYRSVETIRVDVRTPMLQSDLHRELAYHDVGLALEFNQTDLNRQLCLTNKIMAYAQAGLYLLATDTPAQRQFMEEHSSMGTVCGQDEEGIGTGLRLLMENAARVHWDKLNRYEKGKELAWEKESYKLSEGCNSVSL